MTSNSSNKFHASAPYNFVSFPASRCIRYDSPAALPPHDQIDPKGERLDGTITYEITAKTPVLVADGQGKTGQNDNREFFKNPDNRYAVPGSTIRGLVRTSAAMLSFSSLAEEVADSRFLYRTFASSARKLRDAYLNRMGAEQKKDPASGKTYSVLRNVKAGYLKHHGDHQYTITPSVSENGYHYMRLSDAYLRKINQGVQVNYLFQVQGGQENENRQFQPYMTTVYYELSHDKGKVRVSALYPSNKNGNAKKGALLCSGKMKGKKAHYLILQPDPEAAAMDVPKEGVRAYQDDLKLKKFSEQRDGYYFLPKDRGSEKPVFYIEQGGEVHFGFTLFMRVFYDYSVYHGIPKNLKMGSEPKELDYCQALFGFAHKKASFKSRVSFEEALATNDPKPVAPIDMVLGNPKVTCCPLYIGQPDGSDKTKLRLYNDEDFQIRGVKQYWLREKTVNTEAGSANVTTRIKPLPAGTVFRGKIHFRNLAPDELGLLLMALKPTAEANHNIGMAKPYGYGRVNIDGINVHVVDPEAWYGKTFSLKPEDRIEPGEQYVAQFQQKMVELTGREDCLQHRTIKEFQYMKSRLVTEDEKDKFRYMTIQPNEYKDNRPLPTVTEVAAVTANVNKNTEPKHQQGRGGDKKQHGRNQQQSSQAPRNYQSTAPQGKTIVEIAFEKAMKGK